MVVQAAALAGDPAEQPDLVTGSGAEPVVPAGGGLVPDERGPLGAVGGDGAGEPDEIRHRGGVLTGGTQEVLDLKEVMRRSGGRCRCSWVRWFLGGCKSCSADAGVSQDQRDRVTTEARSRVGEGPGVRDELCRAGAQGLQQLRQLEQQQRA